MNENLTLMCKDVPVYSVNKGLILNKSLAPGCIVRGTMSFDDWLKTRYSAGSNASARRLMLRAFAADNHNKEVIKATRALSLSDCYWIKGAGEEISFGGITPYLNKEWDGSGAFKGGSVSTLFVNGAADKKWIDAKTLLKVGSFKEIDPFRLMAELKIGGAAEVRLSDEGLMITNFTSTDKFFESMEQSGFVKKDENAREKAVGIFGEQAAALFAVDYLVEHDDRHWGNYGFMRNADTGGYEGMAPYYDFDWVWSGGVVAMPDAAVRNYGGFIKNICIRAKNAAGNFDNGGIIKKRAEELLDLVDSSN